MKHDFSKIIIIVKIISILLINTWIEIIILLALVHIRIINISHILLLNLIKIIIVII